MTSGKGAVAKGARYFSGNEAAAEGAIASGCRFYAGYPITPSSELMERMAVRLPEAGGVFVQMEDEIASISAVIGASWAGAKAMTATSGPGFSLMQESIGYAAFTETPCVVIDVQRAGPCTGQATKVGSGDIMQAKWGSHGDYQVIALSPWSVQEMYDLTIRAFDLSERFRVPTFVMAEESVGHLRENVRVKSRVKVRDRTRGERGTVSWTNDPAGVAPMKILGAGGRLLVTGSTHDERGFRKTDDPGAHERLVAHINEKILKNKNAIIETEDYFLNDSERVVVAYGFTARTALFAVNRLRKEGMRVGLLRLKTLWPFPEEAVKELGRKVRRLVVPEMNRGQVAGEVKKACRSEVVSVTQTNGEVISPEKILQALRER